LRRRFLDWSMFHVEPMAEVVGRDAARLVTQRNAWLRSGSKGPAIWDELYAGALVSLEECRARYVARLNAAFVDLNAKYFGPSGLSLDWQGVSSGEPIAVALRKQLALDRQRGFTQLSPWRGDLSFRRSNRRWCGSRGENKIAGTLLQLAAHHCARLSCSSPVVLVDDPYAEVTSRDATRLVSDWLESADQVIVTALIEPPKEFAGAKTFHVEQGRPSPIANHAS
jgi:DNA replication and repair protein RecF